MRAFKRGAAIAAVTIAAMGVGAAGAAWAGIGAGDNGQPPPTSGGTRSTRIVTPSITEDRFVPITPCRIVDTRDAVAGKLQVGGSRAFDIKGSGATFAAQGGKAGGCAIPNSATAIEATITAVDSGSGFLRAWPGNLSQPDATFMNYTDVLNVSNTGTVAIDGCPAICVANNDLRLRAYGSATHVVVDVMGYYVPPIWANVTSAGALTNGSRNVGSITAFGSGQYEVGFDRDVSKCSYDATIDNFDTSGGSGTISVDPRSGNEKAVFVQTRNTSGTQTNEPFYLTVTC